MTPSSPISERTSAERQAKDNRKELCWVPVHANTEGSKKADIAAKNVAKDVNRITPGRAVPHTVRERPMLAAELAGKVSITEPQSW